MPARIINPMIKAVKAGLNISLDKLEAHYLAGGNVDRVINALIASHRAGILLEFERACAIDLAGRDVLDAVQMSVRPKVIETPVVAAIAKDGIELRAKARVTVRANIERLVGGAGEETIIARVGEGIVTTVGSAHTHKEVLENPDLISRTVLGKWTPEPRSRYCRSTSPTWMWAATSARSSRWTRRRPTCRSRAKAEERRAMAVAREQEMVALEQEMRARVVRPRPRCPGPCPRRCARASWASWTTTTCRTSYPIRPCANPSRRWAATRSRRQRLPIRRSNGWRAGGQSRPAYVLYERMVDMGS